MPHTYEEWPRRDTNNSFNMPTVRREGDANGFGLCLEMSEGVIITPQLVITHTHTYAHHSIGISNDYYLENYSINTAQ